MNDKHQDKRKHFDRGGLLRLASIASVITAGILIVAKLIAWYLTGSVSLLASLVDSVMDSIASLINLFAIRYSLQPADEEHRFGHGKAEPLAGLAQAAFIAGSAIFLTLHSIDRLRDNQQLEQIGIGIGVMVLAIVMTVVLLAIQRYVIRKTNSTAIRADSLHYATDLLTNLSILLALYLSTLGWTWADPVFAIADEDMEREREEKTAAVHFLRFEFGPDVIELARAEAALSMGVDHAEYRARVDPVPEPIRSALMRDFD